MFKIYYIGFGFFVATDGGYTSKQLQIALNQIPLIENEFIIYDGSS